MVLGRNTKLLKSKGEKDMNEEMLMGLLSDALGIYELAKQVKTHTTGGVMLAPNTVAIITKTVNDTKALVDKLKTHTSGENPSVTTAIASPTGVKKMSWEK